MAARGSRGTSSLLKPLNVIDVLIPDEVVQYNEREHWASLIQPFVETVAILILITMFAGGLPDGALGGFLFLMAAAVAFVMYRQGNWRRVDGPRGRQVTIKRGARRLSVYAMAAGLVIGYIVLAVGLARSGLVTKGAAVLIAIGAAATLITTPGPMTPLLVLAALLLTAGHGLAARTER